VSGSLTLEVVTTPEQLAAALAIRVAVFVREQRVPLELEVDDADADPGTVHVLALLDDSRVGAARLLPPHAPGAAAHIGRVAVLVHARRRQVGTALMRILESEAWRRHAEGVWPRLERDDAPGAVGPLRIELSAQETAVPFYQRMGYAIDERRYLDAGIWHRDAVRILTGPPAGLAG
jgi:predicted GNAT family N-acyltransferase